MNVPSVSKWQWHPFSIASCSRSDKIKFIIKNTGDWTGKLLTQFNEIQDKRVHRRNHHELNRDFESLSVVGDAQDPKYPKINLSQPISSPVQQSVYNYNVVYVAAGVGITTFLGFLELQLLKARNASDKGDTEICKLDNKEVIDFIFISRETENIRWIAKYINAALTLPQMTKKVKFHIYVTLKDESNDLASFLFWRAFAFLNEKLKKAHKLYSRVKIHLGRPDFDTLFDKILHKNTYPEHYVYACGSSGLTNNLEKICTKMTENGTHVNFNYEIF
mmetsp:Transcript_18792/g.18460  ORF Transcript_18792/g.18460 Transcript_18792/m.18460 type:complete len:276 (+) Transcript_18792:217-1044(+)